MPTLEEVKAAALELVDDIFEVGGGGGGADLSDASLSAALGIAPSATISMPARIRGFVDLGTYSGVVVGTVDGTQRTTNHTQMQAAADYADTNGKFLELSPGSYEITSPGGAATQGLHIKKDVAGLRGAGSAAVTITQYGTNVPVMTIGDVLGTNDDLRGDKYYGGVFVQHSADQVGQTNGVGLRLGRLWRCKFEDFNCGNSNGAESYIGLELYTNSGGVFFSNELYRVNVGNGLQHLVKWSNLGTGNKWINCYWGGGGPDNWHTTAGAALEMSNGGGIESETVFDRCNIEWQQCSRMMTIYNMRGLVFLALHLEGCKFTGADPTWFSMELANVKFIGGRWIDMRMKSGELTGTPRMFNHFDYGKGVTSVEDVEVEWGTDGTVHGVCDVPFLVNNPTSNAVRQQVNINNMQFDGQDSTIDIDGNMTEAVTGKPLILDGYRHGKYLSKSDNSKILGPNANFTHYGQHANANIVYWTLTAGRDLTLSNYLGSASPYSTVLRQVGDIVTVTNDAAGGFSITVKNNAGTTIGTVPAGQAGFIFNGTNFVAL